MTILELMVVVMILGLLAVVVLPTLSKSIDSRRFREASRSVSSFVAGAQARALSAQEPRGFLLQPLAADPAAAIDLFFANTPAPYCGEEISSHVTVQPAGLNPNIASLSLSFDPATDARLRTGFCQPGDAIRFGTGGAEYRFLPAGPGSGPHRVEMWIDDSQTPGNTPWPRGERIPFRIRRQPHRASTGVLQLQRGAAVDIAWSCIGTRPLFDPTVAPSNRIIRDLSQPITILFDSSGKPSDVVHSGGIRTALGEPLFLLIGSAEIAGNLPRPGVGGGVPDNQTNGAVGANWQYSDAIWLCIDNSTGATKFGPVAGGAANVLQSQRFVRMTVAMGAAER